MLLLYAGHGFLNSITVSDGKMLRAEMAEALKLLASGFPGLWL